MAIPIEGETKLVTARVARGRTVQYGNRFRNVTRTEPVDGAVRTFTDRVDTGENYLATEGEEISLPPDEIGRLHALGFVRYEGEAETRPPSSSFVTQPAAAGQVIQEPA